MLPILLLREIGFPGMVNKMLREYLRRNEAKERKVGEIEKGRMGERKEKREKYGRRVEKRDGKKVEEKKRNHGK